MELIINKGNDWACTNIAYIDIEYEITHKLDRPKRVEKIIGESVFFNNDVFISVGDSVKCVFKDSTGIVGAFGTVDHISKEKIKISIRRRIDDFKSVLKNCE